MYNASITIAHGSDREYGYDRDCSTLQEAVEQIENWAAGQGDCCRAWINNKEVQIRHCAVIDPVDGEPLCTNEGWHETFANSSQQIKSLRVPTNPSTYSSQGNDL